MTRRTQGRYVYLSQSRGFVSVVDRSTRSTGVTIPGFRDADTVEAGPDGRRLCVPDREAGTVSVIDTDVR